MRNSLSNIIFICLLCTHNVFAATSRHTGLGAVANNLLEPITIFSSFVSTAATVIGLSFLFAAGVKYMQHRVNPLAIPLSTVVVLVVMGAILVLLPYVYLLTASGVAYQP
jgi:choline-glycine betaine transporter